MNINFILLISLTLYLAACGQPEHRKEGIDLLNADSGEIIPTIYYLPVFEHRPCLEDDPKMTIKEHKTNKSITWMCEQQVMECRLQGSCILNEKKRRLTLNYATPVNGEYRFRINNFGKCEHGVGSSGDCLIPFYSIAADLRIYQIGEKIYMPDIKGLMLPDGTAHTGFFTIQDTGSKDKIKGAGRFDFFTGRMDHRDENNPFADLGLGDKSTRLKFYKVE